MTNGNMGDLWFSLGIRENVSQKLNVVLKTIQESEGSVSQLRTALKKYVATLDEASLKEYGSEKRRISNALDYLGMLQKIDAETRKISSLKALNTGQKTEGLDTALKQLKQIKQDLLDLQNSGKFGGVDTAELEQYSKTLRNVMTDVKQMEKAFDKDNSLSNAKNNAARLTNELEKVKNKLSEIYSMQSQGVKNGINTGALLSAGNTLRGVQTRINSMLGNDSLLTNESKYKTLISDIELAFTKATGKIQEYNREKAKANELNKEVKAYDNSVQKQSEQDLKAMSDYAKRYMQLQEEKRKAEEKANKKSISDEKQRQDEIERTRARIQSLSYALQNLWGKRQEGRALDIDTSKADAKIRDTIDTLRLLKSLLNSLQDGRNIGALGNIGNGRDVSSVNHMASEQAKLNQAQVQLNAEKQKAIQLEEKHRQEVAATAAKVRSDLVGAFESARKSASGVSSTVQDLKNLFLQGGIVYGAKQFAESIIQTGGEMEKQHIALQSILGDMQNADIMFNNIKELALKSPFTFSELNRDVKQLAAYGVEYEQLYDTTKRLADISAGLGVSFERIALAFGQVQSRGWLDGKELRQIAYAGIPLLDRLSEYYSKKEGQNVSKSDVKKRISNREVDFSDVKQIFWDMTDAGGQFFNMQEVLSETLLGKYNKLKDAWEIMLADFARGDSIVGGTFKGIIELVTALVQDINTIGPALMAAFAGFAMKKGMTALGGGVGTAILSAKSSVASDIQKRVLLGKQVEQSEIRILATKHRITDEDVKALAASGALKRNDLERLMIQGKITKEIYAQNYGNLSGVSRVGKLRKLSTLQNSGGWLNSQKAKVVKMQLATDAYFTRLKMQMATSGSLWSTFALKGMSAFALLGSGVKALGTTIWAAIGGLPGLIMTAITAVVGYVISANAELDQAMKQSADELENRKKQISEFLRDQDANKAINSGDTKEIDNMIEEYEDKLKELAPSMSQFFIMNANEKQSHEERLKYLRAEMEAMKKANTTAQAKLANEDNFKSLKKNFETSQEELKSLFELKAKAQMYNATDNDKKEYSSASVHYEDLARDVARKFQEILPDIGSNPESQRAVVQMFDNMLAQVNIPEEQADYMRASVMKALGIADGWLNTQVATEMQNLVENSSSVIAEKIRNNIELTDAEKKKVQELMEDAKRNLSSQYPTFSNELQRLLDASNFQAVIKLVYSMQEAPGVLENQVMNNLLGGGKGLLKNREQYTGYAKKWIKGTDDAYEAINRAHQDIDAAYNSLKSWNKMLANGKATKAEVDKVEKNYRDMVAANQEAFGDYYLGTDKKSNKTPKKKNGGRKEDMALKKLQERLSSLKSARQMYQKYKTIFPDDDAKSKTYKLFPEVEGLDLDNYEKAVKSLMDKFNFEKSPERRKLRTSLYREIADWLFTEVDKKAFDKKTADFSESLNRLSEQWDTYKALFEKSGSKHFANAAFSDGYIVDDKAKDLIQQYENRYGITFGLQDAMSMTDGGAKEKLKAPGQYEAWKKITELLRNNYVSALQDGADAMQKTMSLAQKLDAIDAKYAKKIKEANGDADLIERYKFLAGEEKSSLLLDRIKQETDWDVVFGNLDNYSKKELRKVRKQISKLVTGGFLDGMNTTDLQTFYNGVVKLDTAISGKGFGGMKDLIKEMRNASQQYDKAVKKYNEAVKKYGKDSWQAEKARKDVSNAKKRRNETKNSVKDKNSAISSNIATLGNMFVTLGKSNGSGSTLLQNAGSWASSIASMAGASDKNSQKIGGFVGMFAGLTETIAEKGMGGFLNDAFKDIGNASKSILSTKGIGEIANPLGRAISGIFGKKTVISKIFNPSDLMGTNDNGFTKAKEQYDKLVTVWDSLISKKTEYMNIHWGSEAAVASDEARKLLDTEIEQTRKLANIRLGAGSSIGTHSYGYRMWKGSYKDDQGRTWSDVAPEISRKFGVSFDGMNDLANMNADVLQKIKEDYIGLWVSMDSQYREYLEKIIEYGDKVDNMEESLAEKLTGNKFSSLVESWGAAMSTMANYSDNLLTHFEDNLKNVILKSMIENVYGDKIKALIKKTQDYAQNNDKITDANGNVISEYTSSEYADIKEITEILSKDIQYTRDFLESTYGWSDNSSSSTSSSVKSITEETADLLASYINAIRLDVSVNREMLTQIMQATLKLPQLNVIAQSQLAQLNNLVTLAQLRNDKLDSMYDWMKNVTNGTKKLYVA